MLKRLPTSEGWLTPAHPFEQNVCVCPFVHIALSSTSCTMRYQKATRPGCDFYTKFSYDSSRCNSLEQASTVTETSGLVNILRYRYFSFTLSTDKVEPHTTISITVSSATEFDHCLPGPTSCQLEYYGPCPTGYAVASRRVSVDIFTEESASPPSIVEMSITQDYCCKQ